MRLKAEGVFDFAGAGLEAVADGFGA